MTLALEALPGRGYLLLPVYTARTVAARTNDNGPTGRQPPARGWAFVRPSAAGLPSDETRPAPTGGVPSLAL